MNADEHAPVLAKLPGLWGRFFSERMAEQVPNRLPGSPIVGVYSNYESDRHGYYNLTAGVSVSAPNPDFSSVKVEDGDYLVFEGRGPLPEIVAKTWAEIWTFFERSPLKRRYATDFEAYVGPESVEIHIGVVE